MHQRVLIRKAVRELLVAAGTDARGRVFDRVNPVFEDQLPAILIFAASETVDREDITGVGLRLRTVEIIIKGVIKAGASAEAGFGDQLDSLAEQIEDVMDSNPLLNQTAETVWFDKTEFSLSGEGESLLGLVNLTYSVIYRG